MQWCVLLSQRASRSRPPFLRRDASTRAALYHTSSSQSVESDFYLFFWEHGASRFSPSADDAVVGFFYSSPNFLSPPRSQALSLYTKEFDGSAKAVVAAKLGGVELNVLPINKYTGKADAAKVRR